ncbi:MAG: hypothetical protein NT114_03735 [Patescibacteria group bacterium]|nr:hypothetical protein [Patescibacteria group bacterium]
MEVLTKLNQIAVQFIAPRKLVEVSSLPTTRETDKISLAREQAANNGKLILEPDLDRVIDLSALQQSLTEQDYTLVGASIVARQNLSAYQREIYVVRFSFKLNAEHTDVTSIAQEEFDRLADMSFWHACGYLNPSKTCPDDRAHDWLSINLASRVQRFVGEDPTHPILVSQRDKYGNKTSTKAPIKAQCSMSLASGRPLLEKL